MERRFFPANLRFLMAALLVSALALRFPALAGAETYKQSGDGLEKEFEAFLKAYHRGDDGAMDSAFGIFRIPNAKEWFAANFSTEDAQRLQAGYGQQVNDGQNALIEDMNRAGTGNKFSVHCEPRGDVAAGTLKPGSDAAQPLKPIRVEQYLLEFQALGTRQKFRFMANFVYVDGAYRFVGGGGAPFWATK